MLFARLRIKDHRHSHIQTFGNAVHSTMRNKSIRSGKNIELVNTGIHPDMTRQRSKFFAVYGISAGYYDIGIHGLERVNTFLIEIGPFIYDRSHGDINKRPVFLFFRQDFSFFSSLEILGSPKIMSAVSFRLFFIYPEETNHRI